MDKESIATVEQRAKKCGSGRSKLRARDERLLFADERQRVAPR
jgi:hypothetical protein